MNINAKARGREDAKMKTIFPDSPRSFVLIAAAPTLTGGTPVPHGMGVPPVSEGTRAKTKDRARQPSPCFAPLPRGGFALNPHGFQEHLH
jgi:hypothetical protein